MEVVRWIEENEPKMQKVVCHSLNKDAREEMVERLKDAGYDAVELPFIMFGQTGMYEALQSVIQRHADDA
jgi:uroporphyrinogen-III synthase